MQFAASASPPERCPICEDERQYVGWSGQRWTTLDELREKHHNDVHQDLGLLGVGTEPSFAIGQRALLVPSPAGNVLWDCITVIDDAAVAAVRGRGGARAIAISHPHYYSSLVEWSRALDAPVYLHAADKRWVMRGDSRIEHWSGETKSLWDGMTLIRAGGHFEGSTVLHWPAGADGKGAMFCGDMPQVAQDRRYVSFMYSYPNYVPLGAGEVRRIVEVLEPFEFDRIYGAWWDRNVPSGAKEAVRRSAARYIARLGA